MAAISQQRTFKSSMTVTCAFLGATLVWTGAATALPATENRRVNESKFAHQSLPALRLQTIESYARVAIRR